MKVLHPAILGGLCCLLGPLSGPPVGRRADPVTVSTTPQARASPGPVWSVRTGATIRQEGPTRKERQPRKKGGKGAGSGAVSAKDSAALRRRAREAIEACDLDRATRLRRQAAGVRNRSERQAWLLLGAELEYSKKQYAKAALAAMRLVILHPRGEHVGAALSWAGRSYEGLKRPGKAIELYEECLAAKPKPSIRKLAKARLARLRKRDPTP